MLILIIILLLTSFIFNYYELEKKQNYLNQEKSIYLIILLYILKKTTSSNNEYLHLKRLFRVSLVCVFIYYSFKLNKLNSHITLTNILIFSVFIYIIYDIYLDRWEKTPSVISTNIPKEKFTDSKIVVTLEPTTVVTLEPKTVVTLEPHEKAKRLAEIKKTMPPEHTKRSNTKNDPMNFSITAKIEPKKKEIVISKVHLEADPNIINQIKESYNESKKHRENQEKELKEMLKKSKEDTKKRRLGGRAIIRKRKKK